jgi:O-antigen/teichoic acid export membrane protein
VAGPIAYLKGLRGRVPAAITHAAQLLSGTSLAQVIPALLAPVLTRLYHPADFGVFALVYAILTIFSVIVCLRYELAIVLPEKEEDALRLVSICVSLCLVVAVVLELVCIVLLALVPGQRATTILEPVAAMVPIGIVFMGLQQVAQMWCIRNHFFHAISSAMIVQASTTVLVQIGLAAIFGSSPYFLMIGVQAGLVASVGTYGLLVGGALVRGALRHVSLADARALMARFARFPIYTAPYAFITQVAARGIVLLIGSLTTTAILGQFALAQRIIYFPISTIMVSAGQIFFSRAPGRLGEPRFRSFIEWTLVVSPLIAGPPFLVVFLFAEPLFRFFFGANWAEAGQFAAVLVIPSFILTTTAWMDRIYDILGRQRLALLLQIIHDVISLAAIYLVLRLTNDALLAVTAYAIWISVFHIAWTFVTLRIANLPIWSFVVSLVLGALTVLVMFGTDEVMRVVTGSESLRAVAVAAVGLIIVAIGVSMATYRADAQGILARFRDMVPFPSSGRR